MLREVARDGEAQAGPPEATVVVPSVRLSEGVEDDRLFLLAIPIPVSRTAY